MVMNLDDNPSTSTEVDSKPPLSFSISRILDLNLEKLSPGNKDSDSCSSSVDQGDSEYNNASQSNTSPLYNKCVSEDIGMPDQGYPYYPLPYSFWLQDRNSSRRLGHPYQSRAPPKRKKQRASFSRSQIKELEKLFSKKKYLSSSERQQIAKKLDMTDCQVKTWYQNRRTKWKREKEEEKQEERQAMAKALMTTQRDWWTTKSVYGC